MVLLNPYRHTSYTTEYTDVLNRATTLGYTHPSDSQKIKQNTLIANLKSAGIWSLLDVFYVFATDGSSDFATINWKSPSTYQITKVNSPTFTTNSGFTGNGTSSYLNTSWAPSAGVNYTLNNAGAGAYSSTSTLLAGHLLFGAFDASTTNGCYINPGESGSSVAAIRVNSTTANTFSNANASGFFHAKRTASNAIALFKNASSLGTATTASTARSTSSMFLLGHSVAGVASSFSTRNIGMFWAGAGMDTLESSFNTHWNTYLTSL